ncbi:hypothetical protein CT113_00810 [Levilactobacillus brevis]|uniref:hypothetical protein n=1 Tax=Levilactobacillus brevis TaxID=1580 RepID=UPI000414F2F6|nr:hypothetical protein [Levilactobacillus brevis]ATU68946.1 hypothetical protein CT113_00810 [Levilactobacillus brevis]
MKHAISEQTITSALKESGVQIDEKLVSALYALFNNEQFTSTLSDVVIENIDQRRSNTPKLMAAGKKATSIIKL